MRIIYGLGRSIGKFFLILVIFVFAYRLSVISCFAQEIKKPNVKGAFYPDSPEELSQMIDGLFLAALPEPEEGRIIALISPHAGYVFSGPVAAYGYKSIKNRNYKTVIIVGPSHYYGFKGISVYPQGVFQTPLGDVEIDAEFASKLIDLTKNIRFIPQAFHKEHSIEVQIPFLQKALSDFKIVPIIIGDVDFSLCQDLAMRLVSAIGNRKDVIIIASTDMYHGYDFEEAQVIDRFTLSILEKMDPRVLYEKLREGTIQLCGGSSVVVTMLTAKNLGHNKLKILKYTNSAEVTMRKTKGIWTVGYASCLIDSANSNTIDYEFRLAQGISEDTRFNSDKQERVIIQPQGEEEMLNQEQRKRLLSIARQSIEHYLKTGKKLEVVETDPILNQLNGAFVTLHEHGQLRGCIGNIVGSLPVYLTIRDMAVQAAVNDSRFSPLKLTELKEIEIEISILSELKKINDPLSIRLGIDGVLLKRGLNSGVFLPQVATETGWSKEEFLSYLCSHKAGIPSDAWKEKSTEIYVFTAEVFSEKNHR